MSLGMKSLGGQDWSWMYSVICTLSFSFFSLNSLILSTIFALVSRPRHTCMTWSIFAPRLFQGGYRLLQPTVTRHCTWKLGISVYWVWNYKFFHKIIKHCLNPYLVHWRSFSLGVFPRKSFLTTSMLPLYWVVNNFSGCILSGGFRPNSYSSGSPGFKYACFPVTPVWSAER